MSNVIANYLKYAYLQTAAEAFIVDKRSAPGETGIGSETGELSSDEVNIPRQSRGLYRVSASKAL